MEWLFLCLKVLLFLFPSFSSSYSSSNFLCHHDESSALLQFKASFTIGTVNYDGHLLKTTTWHNGTDCCSWHGVKCDTISGHVIGLNLGCAGLHGHLLHNSSLFHLPHLKTLDLSFNHFDGSQFHSKFGGFMSLTHLDLSDSDFQGEIPTQISHLSKLESLHLSNNYNLLWKETTFKRLLQNATNLRKLVLDYTNMSSIRLNSMNSLMNQSSSLVTLNLKSTGLKGNFKNNILCLPNIQELDMSSNSDLEGELPKLSYSASLITLDISYCGFEGSIPHSFSNFTHLNSLILFYNYLNGSIPPSLLTLQRLTSLYLSGNKLSGQIPNVFQKSNKFQEIYLQDNNIEDELPTTLSNLQQLTHLDLSGNSISGQIPDVFGGMTKLEELHLNSNKLEGHIPASLFNLTHIVKLNCSENKLDGPLPKKITGFQKIIDLNLNGNFINGTMPSWLFSLPCLIDLDLSDNRLTGYIGAISSYSLERLYLCDNKLQGNIPESIFKLANLTNLCLSSNNLSGIVYFQHFSKLQYLSYLYLSYNSHLTLSFESNGNYSFPVLQKLYLSSLSLTTFPNLSEKLPSLWELDLSNNKLNGKVPNWLLEGIGFSLMTLNLSQNLFTSIDKISGKNDQLTIIDISHNLLVGDISMSFCNMLSLYFLNMAHNKLTGTIPQCLANLSSLLFLDLQMNKLHGTLPSNFAKDSELVSLNLYGNQLEGQLPKSLSNCKYLEFLNLGSNNIEDRFPSWLQALPNLKVMVLQDNKLHGPIANINDNYSFPSLIIFVISGNNLSGLLPKAFLKNIDAMKIVTQEDNILRNMFRVFMYDDVPYDYVTFTMKGTNIEMVKISPMFVTMDMSRNKFEGEIPNGIGELHALIGLNLSHNRITGPIPKSMANMRNLEWLDLSSNMLTGMIPPELTRLTFLEVLDLSNNHLVGEIPQGNQFNTFSNDSYKGNSGLCGVPMTKECGADTISPPPSGNKYWNEEKIGFGWEPVAIGYGCGMVIGIGIGSWVMTIGKPRWLVMMFGIQPKRRRTRLRRTSPPPMTQMLQMS